MPRLPALTEQLQQKQSLSEADAKDAFTHLVSGDAQADAARAFLTALHEKGESASEVIGAARVLRAHALTIRAPAGAMDTCGTGGDMAHTLNISTAAAFVVAAAGVVVAKHGNRAASSQCGAADVLEALGVNLEMEPARVEAALTEIGIGFLFAQRHHAAMRHVAAVRKSLNFATIFNMLGPLLNPAGVTRQLLGVANPAWLVLLGEALRALGTERAWLVHGDGGLDELAISGPSQIVELADGGLREFTLDPAAHGIAPSPISALRGGDAPTNAAAIRALLDGTRNASRDTAYRDAVCLNAAGALMVAQRVGDIDEGLRLAAEQIDNGAAAEKLAALVEFSHAA